MNRKRKFSSVPSLQSSIEHIAELQMIHQVDQFGNELFNLLQQIKQLDHSNTSPEQIQYYANKIQNLETNLFQSIKQIPSSLSKQTRNIPMGTTGPNQHRKLN
jgi:hypothetical protein